MAADSDIIRLLPDSVANQIAAGEVIQRPASVIKELVENSIDAGATSVQIVVKDAGRTLIQVVDNGSGMSPTDARMAFERHATSKISSADDLYVLHTMGFRGEALPSIAAVAQIDLRTMRRGDTVGSRLCLSESRFESQEPAVCAPGTNLMVKNLFFHMPARRKFLKKDSVELSHIMREFERLALVNVDVAFSITHNDVTLHQLPAGSLKQRVTALFGKSVGAQLIPVETDTSVVRITGFTGQPHAARRRGAPQFFFVNGRNMRHPYFHKAVMNCYSELIQPDMQPAYFINLEVEPSTIDVNIHPQKHEIKFENEQAIWQILTAAIKQALGRVNAAGAIDFDADQAPDIPVFMPDATSEMPGITTDDSYNPFADTGSRPLQAVAGGSAGQEPQQRTVERRSRISAPRDWEKLYEDFTARRDAPLSQAGGIPAEDVPGFSEMPFAAAGERPFSAQGETSLFAGTEAEMSGASCIDLHGKYLVLPSKSGLMIIERRRAHIRVLYDKIIKRLESSAMMSQKLIFPELLNLSPSQSAVLSAATSVVERLGFDISFLGDGTWSISGAPSLPGHYSPGETLRSIVADIEETGQEPSSGFFAPAATALARAAAIPAGQPLSAGENDALVVDLLRSSQPDYTPDGLRIISIISHDRLSKLFI